MKYNNILYVASSVPPATAICMLKSHLQKSSIKSNPKYILTFEKVRRQLTMIRSGDKSLSTLNFRITYFQSVIDSWFFVPTISFVVNIKFKVIVWTFVTNRLQSSMQHLSVQQKNSVWPKLTLAIQATKIGLHSNNNMHAICVISTLKKVCFSTHPSFQHPVLHLFKKRQMETDNENILNHSQQNSILSLLSCFLLYCVYVCRIWLIIHRCRRRGEKNSTNVRIRHFNIKTKTYTHKLKPFWCCCPFFSRLA